MYNFFEVDENKRYMYKQIIFKTISFLKVYLVSHSLLEYCWKDVKTQDNQSWIIAKIIYKCWISYFLFSITDLFSLWLEFTWLIHGYFGCCQFHFICNALYIVHTFLNNIFSLDAPQCSLKLIACKKKTKSFKTCFIFSSNRMLFHSSKSIVSITSRKVSV